MVLEEQTYSYDYNYRGSTGLLAGVAVDARVKDDDPNNNSNNNNAKDDSRLLSFKMPYQRSFEATNWSLLAESTLPLRTSALAGANGANGRMGANYYGGLGPADFPPAGGRRLSSSSASGGGLNRGLGHSNDDLFHASVERRSRDMSRRLIHVNLVSLLINLSLAVVAFYFSFANNSSSTTAFATDCVLDLISSAIVLWRYHGDLSDVYMHAREQIACIYLGALFEISALGIIIKASSDIASGLETDEGLPGYDLIYLAGAAVVAFSVLIVFKWSLYKTIRDKSILLDVINSVISTVFALTLCLMTVLSNFDSSFWYFDPILSIVLALFMAGFGLKVIHQNFHILRPGHGDPAVGIFGSPMAKIPLIGGKDNARTPPGQSGLSQYETNLNASLDFNRANWQKADHSTIAFV